MDLIKTLLGKKVDVDISGKLSVTGALIDIGNDIIVLYNGENYLYIPYNHIQHMRTSQSLLEIVQEESNLPSLPLNIQAEPISYRKILNNAKGLFVEIYITGNQSIHGYITSIMNDYFVFYSPVSHTVFISLNHVKYLIPYPPNMTPYSLEKQYFPVNPSAVPLSRTFEQQVKKLEGKFVAFDLGVHSTKIGLLKKVEENTVELISANGEPYYWNLQHMKTIHLP